MRDSQEKVRSVTEAITVAASTSSDTSWSVTNYGSCSAHVAGAAAMYLEVAPNATPAMVSSAVLSNAAVGAKT